MLHLPVLIQDLAYILIAAAVITLIFRKLKQPVVLGYILAGFLVGPNTPIMPDVSDTASITVWAELGVIFLLFSLGLEFSFKKLTHVGKSALITAMFGVVFMLGAGYFVGHLLNWSMMDSIFLGGILSISSTTIIVKAFEELNMKSKQFVTLVLAVLIVEDLVAVLLLVLLSSLALTQSLSGMELLVSSLRLVFFIVLWFILGIYLIPNILRKVSDLLSNETMLVVSIAFCLLMVVIATHLGFSPALGAFVMGSLLAETNHGQRIEHLLLPVRDLFAAIFFVSVGMLIDPSIIAEHWGAILLLTVVTSVGKLFSASLGALVSGRGLKTSVKSGLSLAQIGEFSFIIATLGLSLKVTSDFLYPVAVAVSALTTFLTPYKIKYSDNIYNWVNRALPDELKRRLERYEFAVARNSEQHLISLIWDSYGIKIFLNSVLITALSLAVSKLLLPFVSARWPLIGNLDPLACMATLLLSAPFLWAIVASPPSHANSLKLETVVHLNKLQFGIAVVRLLIGTLLVAVIISQFTSIPATVASLLLLLSVLAIYFSRYSEPLYKAMEKKFVSNLNEKERAEFESQASVPELAPWNATLTELIVSSNSKMVARTLAELAIKENFGASIAMIERGDLKIIAPTRTDILLPHDRVYVIGTEEQVSALRNLLEVAIENAHLSPERSLGLGSVWLREGNQYIGKTIRECGLRESIHGLIVGIERLGERILNPDSTLVLNQNDLIWIVGDLNEINQLKNAD